MNDSKTLIRSSAISLIIVGIGLFVLCVSRAPRINVDEQLVQSTESDEELSDEEFLRLLESTDDELLNETDSQSTSESILLGDASQAEESEDDEDLSEIFRLLNMEEGETEADVEDDADDLEKLLFSDETETQSSSAGGVNASAMSDLKQEIDRLERVVGEKDSEIAMINQSIYEYDQQIADLESGTNYPGGGTSMALEYGSSSESGTSEAATTTWDESSPFVEKYNTALDYFYNRQYQLSVSAFQKLLDENPYHELADNCQYWIAESYYARGNYYQAIIEFEKVFSYDAPDKRDDAQIMMGLANLKVGLMNEAKSDLSWFLTCYQTSEYYSKARYYYNEF